MPVQVVCHACTKSIRAPDQYIGKRVKCPGCGTSLQVNDPFSIGQDAFTAAPPPAGDFGGSTSAGSIGGKRTAWGNFNLGLAIVAITVLAGGGLVAVCLLIGVLATNLTMFQVGFYIALSAVLAEAVGFYFCAALPAETGERGMMQAASLFFIPGASIMLLNTLLGFASYFSSIELALFMALVNAAGLIGMFAAQVFYTMALRGVALHLKSVPLAKNVFAFMVYVAAVPPIWLFYMGISIFFASGGSMGMGRGRGGMGGPSMMEMRGTMDVIIVLTLTTSVAVWFAYLLNQLRGLVSRTQKLGE